MSFHPDQIEPEHVLEAIKTIETTKEELIPSTRWLVNIKGKNYPPKEVMRRARKELDGSLDWDYGGGPPTNKYLERMGFKILDMDNSKPPNLKEEFIKWFFENTNGRYDNLKEDTVREDIIESEKHFNRNIFIVNESNHEEIIDFLRNELYRKDGSFYKFSEEVQHHRPRAILGKENYLKFLKEKFGSLSEEFFLKTAKKFKKEELIKFFDFLEELILKSGITRNDERVAFSCAQDSLSLTVGQRPSWRLTSLRGFRYVANADVKLSEYATKFDGSFTHFYNQFYDIDLNNHQKESIIRTTKIELSRTNKTGYSKFHNPYFEKAAFDISYRNDVLNLDQMSTKKIFETSKNELNTILYGPPGTGKTYRLQKKYFDKFTVTESSLTKEQFLDNFVVDLTWWQTFAIALKDLGTVSTSVLLEHPIVKAKERMSNAKTIKPIVWSRLQAHTVEDCPNVKVTKRSEPQIFYKEEDSKWRVNETTINELYPEVNDLIDQVKNYQSSSNRIIKNYEFVTFHQSFSYEDFIEGIKPRLGEDDNEIAYEIQDGIFKKLCLKANADRDNDYAIFIDEINRGNVSAIFGELITLIEKDKRLGEENELSAKLPYSKEELGVPPNLYIFGTMNTADRSVEALDTALRRRFAFEEVMPLPELLENIEFNQFNLSHLLKVINGRIEALLDRDHTIGHSYFIKIQSGDIEALKHAFENKIIPLLQEYFYHDYEKIAWILGEGFVQHKEATVKFAKLKKMDPPEMISSFELRVIEDIEEAILILLNEKNEESE